MAKKNQTTSQRPRWADSTLTGGKGRRWTGIVAPILLGALLLAAGIVVFWPQPSSDSAAPSAEPSTPSSEVTELEAQGRCPAVASTDEEAAAPDDLKWTGAYGNSWPVSATAGPTKEIDGLGYCFAHSPTGAALAAVNLARSFQTADIETAERILDTQYIPGVGTEITRENMREMDKTQPAEGRSWGRIMGFKVLAYTPEIAQVLVVDHFPQLAQFTGLAVTLVWSEGDWKVRLNEDGQTSEAGYITVDPDGFTRWEQSQ